MNEQVKIYIEKYPTEIVDMFRLLRQAIYDSVPFGLTETMWAKLPSYYLGENFVRLIPFKDHINIEAKAVIQHKEELAGYKITPKGMLQIYSKQDIPHKVLRQIFVETLGKQMLLTFNQMTEPQMCRMVHEIYIEASMENATDKHPELSDLTEAIKEEERYFIDFLKTFFSKEQNTYYVLDVDGQWVSALRLTKIDDFYYMEALETAPNHRRKGYAAALIREVISSLSGKGAVKIRSNVNKKNIASLATHRKCGFTIEEENGINYLYGEQYDHLYGMMYSSEVGDEMTSGNEPRQKNEMVSEGKMRLDEELRAVIARISQMESYLDDVLQTMNTSSEVMNTATEEMNSSTAAVKTDPAIREKIQALKNYYENGLWLADYQRDERGELPMTLKRGGLSQDTLYDLLHEIEYIRSCGE
ncbi:MAG: GNAT family N-acetyltransferase [Lachnospiraceae bacterium]|nr:GNAT family N-acetyltransferase [Lachnospiraceae bacterium]